MTTIQFGKHLKEAYHYLVIAGGFLKSPLLLLCRLYWGWLFFQAGLEKFHDIESFARSLDSMHVPLPSLSAHLAAYTELIGGLCLLVGFASRLVSIPLIIVMLTAYLTVYSESIHSILTTPSHFVAEAPFNFLLTALLVLAFGPGRFSADYWLEKKFFGGY